MNSLSLPPGPSAPPLVQSLLFARDPLGALMRARGRYGPVFTLHFATAGPAVVVTDPEAALALIDDDTTHAGEARRQILPQASPHSMFGADGDEHRTLRARCAPAFAPDAVAAHAAAIEGLADRHVTRWPRGRPFRLLPRMRTLVEEIFVRYVLGVEQDPRADELVAAVRRVLWTPGNPPLVPPDRDQGPLGAAVDWILERRLQPLRRLLGEELAERRAAGRPGPGIIGHILTIDPTIEATRLTDELLVVLAAAQEPPSIAATWAIDELSRHPGLADRLADAGAADPGFDAAIDECLRMHPPALASLRRLTEERTIAGHRLPAGTDVMLPIAMLHRDPRQFPEPERFRPERYAAGEIGAFVPFGGGGRRCPGEPLAQVELGAIIGTVLRQVRIRPLARRTERPVQRATVVVPRASGLVIAWPRRE